VDAGVVGPEAYTKFWGPEYKIRYESEYLFRAPSRVLEGALKLKVH
jgi:hypothetical protein